MTRKGQPRLAALLPTLLLALLAFAPVAYAHHSLAAEFDVERTVELTGVVTKVEWTNPHTYIYLDVRTGDGKTERWAWQLASPNGLERHGWTASSVQVGDRITASGTPARDGSRKANTLSIRLTDGKRLSAELGDPEMPQ
jgi:Family of unknown function (DUF6152)